MRRRAQALWWLASAILLLSNLVVAARAQVYPGRTIRLIVPFGPGGPTDVSGRLAARAIEDAFGQPVVIENRPGAGGATGSRQVAAAPADGYTLLLATSATLAVVPALVKNPGYDPVTSFSPIARIADSTIVLITYPEFPANSVAEFVAYAKAHPGALSYASAGAGNQTHLTAEMLNHDAGIAITHVPYKSGAEMVTAVLGRQVQTSFPEISISLPLIREGKLKALAVTAATRHPQLPDVPTMIESGMPEVVTTFWTGLVAPAGTPGDVVDKLNAAISNALRSPQLAEALARLGAQASPSSPEEFARFIATETEKWRLVAGRAGMVAQ